MNGKKIYYVTKIVSTMNDLFFNIMLLIIKMLHYCCRRLFYSIGQLFYLVKTKIKQICLSLSLNRWRYLILLRKSQ